MRITYTLLVIATLALAGGCAGSDPDAGLALREQGVKDFAKAYTSYVDLADLKNSMERPVIFKACAAESILDMEYYIKKYIENGYLLVGEVFLSNANYSLEIASDHCGKLGVEQVLYHTEPSSAGTAPSPGSSFSTATFQGLLGNYPGAFSPAFQQAESGNYPYQTRATYWVKVKPPTLGAYYGEIPAVTAPAAGKPVRGAYVYLVIRNSPADRSKIKAGDIITRLEDYKIYSPEALTRALAAKAGRPVNLRVNRKGESFRISLRLNPPHR